MLSPSPSEKLLGPGHGPSVWPLRERLALATALMDVDNHQANWPAIAKKLTQFHRPDRPLDWCSAKACAKQYSLLLDSSELTRRQIQPTEAQLSRQHILHVSAQNVAAVAASATAGGGLSVTERLVRRLTAERVDELRERIIIGQKFYSFLKTKLDELDNGVYNDHLDEMRILLQAPASVDSPPQITATRPASSKTKSSKRNAPSIADQLNEFSNMWKSMQATYTLPSSVWSCPLGTGLLKRNRSAERLTGTTSSSGGGGVSNSRLTTLLTEASATFRSSGSSNATPLSMLDRRNRRKSMLEGTSRKATAATRAAAATRQRYLSKQGSRRMQRSVSSCLGRGRKRDASNTSSTLSGQRRRSSIATPKRSASSSCNDSSGASTPSTTAMYSSDEADSVPPQTLDNDTDSGEAAPILLSTPNTPEATPTEEMTEPRTLDEPATPATCSSLSMEERNFDVESSIPTEAASHTDGASSSFTEEDLTMTDAIVLENPPPDNVLPPQQPCVEQLQDVPTQMVEYTSAIDDTLPTSPTMESVAINLEQVQSDQGVICSPPKPPLEQMKSDADQSAIGSPSSDRESVKIEIDHPVPSNSPMQLLSPILGEPIHSADEAKTPIRSHSSSQASTSHTSSPLTIWPIKSPTVDLSLLNESQLMTRTPTEPESESEPNDISLQPTREVAITLTPCMDHLYATTPTVLLSSTPPGHTNSDTSPVVVYSPKSLNATRRSKHRSGRKRHGNRYSSGSIDPQPLASSPFVSLSTLDESELRELAFRSGPTATVQLETISLYDEEQGMNNSSTSQTCELPTPVKPDPITTVSPPRKKHRSLRLRFSRKGSHLVVSQPDATREDAPSEPSAISPVATTSSLNSSLRIQTPLSTTFVMSLVMEALESFKATCATNRRSPASLSVAKDQAKRSLLLRLRSITESVQTDPDSSGALHLDHQILSLLAAESMAHSSSSIQYQLVQHVYRRLQPILSQSNWQNE